jgi:hypothetical protein
VIRFPAFASDFKAFPKSGQAFDALVPLLIEVAKVDFTFQVDNPKANQAQLSSDFDTQFEKSLLANGAETCSLPLPPEIPQELDFAFTFSGHKVAVEIEKSNREKILRDFLKCHMYFHAGADLALVVLPCNYPHKLGIWNLFELGFQRLQECSTYGFGTADNLDRILLLGFTQYDAATGLPFSVQIRQEMRKSAFGS